MIQRISVIILFTFAMVTAATAENDQSVRTQLQCYLQQHTNDTTIDGKLLDIDLRSGEIDEYYPSAAHGKIIKIGKIFVLCYDLVRPDSSSASVDFFLAPKGDGFVVIKTEFDNREELRDLIRTGVAKVWK